jgi:hypothetical protein
MSSLSLFHYIVVPISLDYDLPLTITEYLVDNGLYGCEGKEFLVFVVLHKNLQNPDSENTQNLQPEYLLWQENFN